MTAWVRPTDEHWTLCFCNRIWFLSRRRSCGYSPFSNQSFSKLGLSGGIKGFGGYSHHTSVGLSAAIITQWQKFAFPQTCQRAPPRLYRGMSSSRSGRPSTLGSDRCCYQNWQKRSATEDWQKPWERSLRVTSIYILLHLLTRDRNWDRGGCRGIRRGILHKPMQYNPKLTFTVNAVLILQTFSKW